MPAKKFIAVDLGAESGRVMISHWDGKGLTLADVHRFPNGPIRIHDTIYWDILRLWQEIKTGIAKAIAEHGEPDAIGIDTWGVDFAFVGKDGRLLENPIHYRDKRTTGMMEAAFQLVPKAEIYGATGIQFMSINSLYQVLSIAKRASTNSFAPGSSLLFIPDLLNYFLTGVTGSEYTIASTSQMLDARTKNWASTMLQQLGIPPEIMAPILATGTSLGKVSDSLQSEFSAGNAKVIATASHDTAAAVAAVPATGENWCYISSGTWSLMGAEIREPAISPQTLANNFTNEGGVDGTIRLLKNIMGLWLVQECRRSFQRAGKSLEYADLIPLAERAPENGPIINPDDPTFIAPDDMVVAIRKFCQSTGQEVPEGEGAIVRCCLESLALRYRLTLEQLEQTLGKRLDVIHIVGGGCKNEVLCQWTADCCERVVLAGPVEATAIGNALVQAVAIGELASIAEARAALRSSYDLRKYEPRTAGKWHEKYERFLKLI